MYNEFKNFFIIINSVLSFIYLNWNIFWYLKIDLLFQYSQKLKKLCYKFRIVNKIKEKNIKKRKK
jgi:hypothetical protein